jgi:hypothetical protein
VKDFICLEMFWRLVIKEKCVIVAIALTNNIVVWLMRKGLDFYK